MHVDPIPPELPPQPSPEHATQLASALWQLDRAVQAVLSDEVAASPVAFYELDEVRGRIWARYDAASDYLKARELREARARNIGQDSARERSVRGLSRERPGDPPSIGLSGI